MNKKFIFFSIIFCLILVIFVNLITPVSVWSKIVFFLIIFSCLVSIFYIFSKNHCFNLSITSYLTGLLLLRFFHQLFLINFIFLTCFFICIFFIFYKKDIK
ncbi:MAG: hypothetical protein WC895_01890 [Candidatus Shapirobacteria bacterium]